MQSFPPPPLYTSLILGSPGGGKGKHKGGNRAENVVNPNAQPPGGEGNPPSEGKRGRKTERMNVQGNPSGPPPPPQEFNPPGGGKHRGEVQGQPQGQEQPRDGQGKGKKNKGEASPGPSPQ